MPSLIVNVDLVAALRELKHLAEPDPAQAAVLAELGGAGGIAIQLRRDRKYIRDRDLYILKGVVKTKLNVELPPAEDIIERALEAKPWMVTLVADHADSNTPVSTIDFGSVPVDFGDTAERFKAVGVKVCFYIEPEGDRVRGAAKAGATAVLLNASGYTLARTVDEAQAGLDKMDKAAQSAAKAGLDVHCGRGITYWNVTPLVELGNIDEFVIGHAVCARAMLSGFQGSVQEMMSLIRSPLPTR